MTWACVNTQANCSHSMTVARMVHQLYSSLRWWSFHIGLEGEDWGAVWMYVWDSLRYISRSMQYPANSSWKMQWSYPDPTYPSGWCRSILTTALVSLTQLWHIFTISSIGQNKYKLGKLTYPNWQYSSSLCTSKACIPLYMRHCHQHSWIVLSHSRHLRITCTIYMKQKQCIIPIIFHSHSPAHCLSRMSTFPSHESSMQSPTSSPPHCSFTSFVTPASQHMPKL